MSISLPKITKVGHIYHLPTNYNVIRLVINIVERHYLKKGPIHPKFKENKKGWVSFQHLQLTCITVTCRINFSNRFSQMNIQINSKMIKILLYRSVTLLKKNLTRIQK